MFCHRLKFQNDGISKKWWVWNFCEDEECKFAHYRIKKDRPRLLCLELHYKGYCHKRFCNYLHVKSFQQQFVPHPALTPPATNLISKLPGDMIRYIVSL